MHASGAAIVDRFIANRRTSAVLRHRSPADRGNDFFAAFLGPRMVYTSGVYYECPVWTPATDGKSPAKQTGGTSLEEAQDNKMSLICDRLQLKPGQKYMDIGCGWGTLMRHAAREYGVDSTGVTLSVEGAKWCNAQIKQEGIEDTAQILRMDYRDIPKGSKFNAISAIEMAEHVGIANFQLFLGNIYDNLEDDGYFLMQVAGLRKGSNWQDTAWGIFMSKYIFPGADASTPLNWYIKQLEKAGFEVQRTENIGRHYSHTLHGWYDHWMKNRNDIMSKSEYESGRGVEHEKHENASNAKPGGIGRLWDFFLAWSVIASGQCSATCYQMLCHKNIYDFPRDKFCDAKQVGMHMGKRGLVTAPNKNQ
jgi:cyclopropane fatty-acyl-phospholipid synthase-like methyltransferase